MQAEIDFLVRKMHELWSGIKRTTDSLPEIAGALLAESNIQAAYRDEALSEWMLRNASFPSQLDDQSNFGNPPLTVYNGGENSFAIDVYFWTSADTSIHDHGFAGACQLLKGKSVAAEYQFESPGELCDGIEVGNLTCGKLKFLHPGDIFAIPAGRGLIHQVSHLPHPTVTIVIRNNYWIATRQYLYFRNCAVAERNISSPYNTKCHRLLQSLRQCRPELATQFFERLASHPSSRIAVSFLLQLARDPAVAYDEIEAGLDKLIKKHGPEFNTLGQVLENIRCSANFDVFRFQVANKDLETKQLVAFLQAEGLTKLMFDSFAEKNVDGAEKFKAQLRRLTRETIPSNLARFPGATSPVFKVISWIDDLVNQSHEVADLAERYKFNDEERRLLKWLKVGDLNKLLQLRGKLPSALAENGIEQTNVAQTLDFGTWPDVGRGL